MIRHHKKMLVFTSIVTLLPIVIGLLLWKHLPASVAIHFGADGQPNGYSSKIFAVFGLSFILLLLHFSCAVITNIDPNQKILAKKYFGVFCGFARWFLWLFVT